MRFFFAKILRVIAFFFCKDLTSDAVFSAKILRVMRFFCKDLTSDAVFFCKDLTSDAVFSAKILRVMRFFFQGLQMAETLLRFFAPRSFKENQASNIKMM